MKRIIDVVYAGIVKCLDSITAPKFIGNLQGTADKARGIEGLTASVDELNHVKGVTNGVQNQIDNLTKAINDATALRASLEQYGMTKVTSSEAVTDSTGLALAATEKNASIDGTLANQISKLNSDIVNLSKYVIAGNNTVSFVNSNHVIGRKVTLGFRPSMVCIQSHDPVITFGIDSFVDDGFIVNAYCITGNVNAIYKFSYLCTK